MLFDPLRSGFLEHVTRPGFMGSGGRHDGADDQPRSTHVHVPARVVSGSSIAGEQLLALDPLGAVEPEQVGSETAKGRSLGAPQLAKPRRGPRRHFGRGCRGLPCDDGSSPAPQKVVGTGSGPTFRRSKRVRKPSVSPFVEQTVALRPEWLEPRNRPSSLKPKESNP